MHRKQELLTFRKHLSSFPAFGWVRVAHLFSFLCYPIMRRYFLSSVLQSSLRFPHKIDVRFVFTSSCLQASFYLRYLCLFTYSVVQQIFCNVFALFVFVASLSMLPVSLDCPVFIVPSIFSNVFLLPLFCRISQKNPKGFRFSGRVSN